MRSELSSCVPCVRLSPARKPSGDAPATLRRRIPYPSVPPDLRRAGSGGGSRAQAALHDLPIDQDRPTVGVEERAAVLAGGGIHATDLDHHRLAVDLPQLVIGERRIAEEVNPVHIAAGRFRSQVQHLESRLLQVVALLGGNRLRAARQNLPAQLHRRSYPFVGVDSHPGGSPRTSRPTATRHAGPTDHTPQPRYEPITPAPSPVVHNPSGSGGASPASQSTTPATMPAHHAR